MRSWRAWYMLPSRHAEAEQTLDEGATNAMAGEAVDFGVVERVQVDAVGVPGQRRFRLRARTATESAVLWIEREQAQAIGLAIEQLLAQVQVQSAGARVTPDPGGPLDDFPMTSTLEFTVGRLGIGYDESNDLVVLQLSNIEEAVEPEADPLGIEPVEGVVSLIIRFSRAQAAAVREQVDATLSAGRPRCPLCGTPMGADGEHMCVRRNGHAKGAIEGQRE